MVVALALSLGMVGAAEITHGPILGRLSSTGIGVWARTARSGEFHVRYGTTPGRLDQSLTVARTSLGRDNTGWVHITGLEPHTTYYYEVVGEAGSRSRDELKGDFRTLPNADTHRHAELNPDGLFNFRFEYACGNQQRADPSLPTFRTMLDRIEDSIDFAILDGDWMYEERREYTADQWRGQTAAETTPRIVALAPTITGVWENYKLYLTRGKNLAAWHREVPPFFMFDDHEMLNDVNGTGTPGLRSRRAVFRESASRLGITISGGRTRSAGSRTYISERPHCAAGETYWSTPRLTFANSRRMRPVRWPCIVERPMPASMM